MAPTALMVGRTGFEPATFQTPQPLVATFALQAPEGLQRPRKGNALSGHYNVLDASILSQLISFSEWAKKKGYREHTILANIAALKSISRHASLSSPEQVSEYLAHAELTESRKEKIAYDYGRYCKFRKISYEPPKFRPVERLPFIPQESEVDALIGGMGRKMAGFLQLLRETGARPGEAWQLKWIDIDLERRTVSITAEKHSHSRQLRVSDRCLAMVNSLPKQGRYVFHPQEADQIKSLVYARRVYQRRRKRLAERLQNPRISQISFKTLRHFKATMFYHSTKDILATMQLLGHKNIRNTLVYTHLVSWESDEFFSKVAKTVKEAQELAKSGFDYVCDVEGYKVFRKRK